DPSFDLGDGGAGRGAEPRAGVHLCGLEQLAVPPGGLRDRGAPTSASAVLALRLSFAMSTLRGLRYPLVFRASTPPAGGPGRSAARTSFGHIDRGIRRHLRCRDTCGLLPKGLAIWRPACVSSVQNGPSGRRADLVTQLIAEKSLAAIAVVPSGP